MILLDTHCAVWLFEGKEEKFSARALRLIQSEDIFISPIVVLELEYLFESKRIAQRAKVVLKKLTENFNVYVDIEGFSEVLEAACDESWTREPFDRIITAHARVNNCVLLTKDLEITARYKKALC